MFRIKTLNEISPVIGNYLTPDDFAISSDMENPEAVLVRSADMHAMTIPEALLAVGRAGAGTNNIPIDRCSDAGIVVFNTPGANANAVKELVICGLLLSGRKVVDAIQWASTLKGKGTDVPKLVEKGKGQFVGPEVKGKRIGVIGLGAIGVMVANAARGLDMEVSGYDPFISVQAAWGLSRSVERVQSLERIFQTCDYITLHVPLSDATRNMVGADQLALMKPEGVVLNFSRAELVDTKAMLSALDAGRISRYVTDFPTDDLLCHAGVIAIPHLGASTPESEDNCAAMAARQIRDYLENGAIAFSVNFPDCELARNGAYRVAIIHRNVTNMVGQITTALAAENHNIANMVNKSRAAMAYTLLDLDDKPTDACLNHLAAIDGVLRVRSL